MHWRALIAFVCLLAQPLAWADLPLTVEDLISERGQWRLELGLTHANLERQGVATGEPIEVQTGAATFVLLPTTVGGGSTTPTPSSPASGCATGWPSTPRFMRA